MIWATDRVGIETLLFPNPSENYTFSTRKGISQCHSTMSSAIEGEISASLIMQDAGYKIDALMTIYHSHEDFLGYCKESGDGDFLFNNTYNGTNVQPYETIFTKADPGIDPILLEKLTAWHAKGKYSSWERCLP